MTNHHYPPLITGLLEPDAYSHAVRRVCVRETHISWVLLTGEWAYKIKKPVDLGFVNFTDLESRRYFCQEELRLNRRFAPDLYLDVVPITEKKGRLRVANDGQPIEYAVRMRQFDERQLLSRLLPEGRLEPRHVDETATVMAGLHSGARRSEPGDPWGLPDQVWVPASENFAEIRALIHEPSRIQQLDALETWSQLTFEQLRESFSRRKDDRFIRDCHGDMHLGNIVLWNGAVTPFDCIEFNPAFRWIDVMNEVAFLVMDLEDHGRADYAGRFLNAYLEQTGDYSGLGVLPFYLVYRAIVRAKVDALRLAQSGVAKVDKERLATEWHGYLDLAERYTRRPVPTLTITHGLSGSGKTTGTQSMIEQRQAIRVRSDIERKRMFNSDSPRNGDNFVGDGIYSPEATSRTYERLAELARQVIQAGFSVIVDATFLRREQRRRFEQLAEEAGVSFQILSFMADRQTLEERIQNRRRDGLDASDATVAVLDAQINSYEPLMSDEQQFVVTSPTAPDTAPGSRLDN